MPAVPCCPLQDPSGRPWKLGEGGFGLVFKASRGLWAGGLWYHCSTATVRTVAAMAPQLAAAGCCWRRLCRPRCAPYTSCHISRPQASARLSTHRPPSIRRPAAWPGPDERRGRGGGEVHQSRGALRWVAGWLAWGGHAHGRPQGCCCTAGAPARSRAAALSLSCLLHAACCSAPPRSPAFLPPYRRPCSPSHFLDSTGAPPPCPASAADAELATFHQEVQLLAGLRHRNIVQASTHGVCMGRGWVPGRQGRPLWALLQCKRVPAGCCWFSSCPAGGSAQQAATAAGTSALPPYPPCTSPPCLLPSTMVPAWSRAASSSLHPAPRLRKAFFEGAGASV